MTDSSNNDPIAKALGIKPMITQSTTIKTIMSDAHDDSARADFETARANIHTMIDVTQDAIDKLSQIADSSQHPRAYEVLGQLIDKSLSASKDLLALQEKIRALKNADEANNPEAKIINNNLYVGTTAELQKLISGMGEDNG